MLALWGKDGVFSGHSLPSLPAHSSPVRVLELYNLLHTGQLQNAQIPTCHLQQAPTMGEACANIRDVQVSEVCVHSKSLQFYGKPTQIGTALPGWLLWILTSSQLVDHNSFGVD